MLRDRHYRTFYTSSLASLAHASLGWRELLGELASLLEAQAPTRALKRGVVRGGHLKGGVRAEDVHARRGAVRALAHVPPSLRHRGINHDTNWRVNVPRNGRVASPGPHRQRIHHAPPSFKLPRATAVCVNAQACAVRRGGYLPRGRSAKHRAVLWRPSAVVSLSAGPSHAPLNEDIPSGQVSNCVACIERCLLLCGRPFPDRR